jgi:hypothetical protein
MTLAGVPDIPSLARDAVPALPGEWSLSFRPRMARTPVPAFPGRRPPEEAKYPSDMHGIAATFK